MPRLIISLLLLFIPGLYSAIIGVNDIVSETADTLSSDSVLVGPVLQGRLFYCSFRPEGYDVFISHSRADGFERFTEHPANDYDAVISPDGNWVVFCSEREGNPTLFVKGIDGKSPAKRLLSGNSMQDQACFSPDGKELYFVSTHLGEAEICSIPFSPDTLLDVSESINLSNHSGGDFRPSVSPDGRYLAFCSDRDHGITPHPNFPFANQRNGNLYLLDLKSGATTRLTDSEYWDGSPHWSADGQKIYFYRHQNNQSDVCSISVQRKEFETVHSSGNTLSPVFLSSGELAFTELVNRDSIRLSYLSDNGEVLPLFASSPGIMLNLHAHPNGSLVFHGAEIPVRKEPNMGSGGFRGELLVVQPDTIAFAGQTLLHYAIRRAFPAPAFADGPFVVFDVASAEELTDVFTPWALIVPAFPIFVILLFLVGLIWAFKKRKSGMHWRYLAFSLIVLLLGLGAVLVLLYVDAGNPQSVSVIRWTMLGVALVFSLLYLISRLNKRKLQNASLNRLHLNKGYAVFYSIAALWALAIVIVFPYFETVTSIFYKVNYLNGEKESLFEFRKPENTNLAFAQILDTKMSPDGSEVIFTSGGFRAMPSGQGDIWSFSLKDSVLRKLSDSEFNDGFADVNADGSSMVFRSGRDGHPDLFIKEGEKVLNLTNDAHRDNFPVISRDGNRIVFVSDREAVNEGTRFMALFLMERKEDGSWSDPRRISAGQGHAAHPCFSPDGEWVLFTTEAYGIADEQPLVQPLIFSPQMYGEIVALNIQSGELHRITHNKWEEGAPQWAEIYK